MTITIRNHNINSHRGSILGVVIGIIALAAVALGVYYYTSKPGQAQVDELVRQWKEWTPENIQKNKVGYLQWGIGAMEQRQAQLEAQWIALSTTKQTRTNARNKLQDKYERLKNFQEEGKKAYEEAEKNNQWPTIWKEVSLTQSAFQGHLLKYDTLQKNTQSLAETYETLVKRVDVALKELEQATAKAKENHEELKVNLELLKTQEAIKDIDKITESIGDLVVTSSVLVGEGAKKRTLDDAFKEYETQSKSNQADFDKLMGR